MTRPLLRTASCTRDGSIRTFDFPGSFATAATSINPAGAITGQYSDSGSQSHGFLRTRDGTFETFDPPGSTFTLPVGINPAGLITGWYQDVNSTAHSSMRARDGSIRTFDPPEATLAANPQASMQRGKSRGIFQVTDFCASTTGRSQRLILWAQPLRSRSASTLRE